MKFVFKDCALAYVVSYYLDFPAILTFRFDLYQFKGLLN